MRARLVCWNHTGARDSYNVPRDRLKRWRFDSSAKIERDALRDEVPVADEPGFYEPGRSPSFLLANWFWLRHIARALRWWRP